jgi:hypothetical protein
MLLEQNDQLLKEEAQISQLSSSFKIGSIKKNNNKPIIPLLFF